MKRDILSKKRLQMDRIDRRLSQLLLQRRSLVEEIVVLKKKNDLCLRDKNREHKIIQCIQRHARNKSEKKYLKQIYQIIFANNPTSSFNHQ